MYSEYYNLMISQFFSTVDLTFLESKTICMTGGTGLILSFFVDAVLESDLNIDLVLLCKNREATRKRFERHLKNKHLIIVECDILSPIELDYEIDYILSGASYTDPYNYGKFPVETISINVLSNYNMFELAKKQSKLKKFFAFSSCEIYGECEEILNEKEKGIVNCLDVRSCYNESKRVVETMAVAYNKEYNIPTVIGRFSRIYGPTMKLEDSKALSQFIKKAIQGEDVVLKSDGNQLFSYCYVADAVRAIIILLEKGENAQAYNIANDNETLSLKNIAKKIAQKGNVELKFEIPDVQESNGYSRAKVAIQDCSKLKELGWNPLINMDEGLKLTMNTISDRMKREVK